MLSKKPKIWFLYLTSFFWGLAVFHHQTSILLAPAIVYLVLKTDKNILKKKVLILKLFLFFCLGFLPYFFIPFAAWRQTPINWDDPSNLRNFVRLITRADYGTFTAADFIFGTDIKLKLAQIVKLFLFLKADFKPLGLGLFFLGFLYSYSRYRVLFWFIFLCLFFTGPLFLFYASFPLTNDFYTGLWERFVLLSYLFFTLYIAFGIFLIFKVAKKLQSCRGGGWCGFFGGLFGIGFVDQNVVVGNFQNLAAVND